MPLSSCLLKSIALIVIFHKNKKLVFNRKIFKKKEETNWWFRLMVPICHSCTTGYFTVSLWHKRYLICKQFNIMKWKQLRYAKSGQQPEGCINGILEKSSFLERSDCRDCILQLAILLHFSPMLKFNGFHVEVNKLLPRYSHYIQGGIKCYNHAIKYFFQALSSIRTVSKKRMENYLLVTKFLRYLK